MASFALTPFLIWLMCVGIAALAIGLLIKSMSTEGFNTSSPIIISTCPASTETYITREGDTNCCDGDVVDNRCNGRDVCSLSPSSPTGLMSCADWIIKEWAVRSSRFCTNSMPYYFGTMNRRSNDVQGCSASQCKHDGGSPQDPNKPKCKIYNTSVEDYGKLDSCFNAAALERLHCPIPNATKNIISTGSINGVLSPVLFQCTYTPPNRALSNNLPVTCYDVQRFKTYFIRATNNTESDKWIDASSLVDVGLCPASKAYYVDGTLTRANAIGLPGSVSSPAACPTTPALPPGADPRCYVNGVLVGTPYIQGGSKNMGYTEKECKQIGGVYDGIYCSHSANFNPRSGTYNDICGKLSSNSSPQIHPKCLVNGVKLGKQEYGTVIYTPSECSQLGGIFNPKGEQGRGSCTPPSSTTDPWYSYNTLCSE